VFAGLVLTSISTVMVRAALFQRKDRSGWLEELDGIREDALNVADDDDAIWTDLREGGVYDDPHEISSLYATDETPDLPITHPKASAKPKPTRPRRPALAKDEPAPAGDVSSILPPPPPTLPVVIDADPAITVSWLAASAGAPRGATADGDQLWVQPAPHPVHPSEMWHPAELAPPALGDDTFDTVADEREIPIQVEAGLIASADLTMVDDPLVAPSAPDPRSEIALVPGPVGRRVRRDRPAGRQRPTLPGAGTADHRHEIAEDRGEQPRLATAPPPPAARPAQANRLPSLGTLPATPSSVVALPATPTVPTIEAERVAPQGLAVDVDGLVDVAGLVVRIGGDRMAEASLTAEGPVVALSVGWCWVSPGDGDPQALRLELPSGRVTAAAGSSVLVVAEADGSLFVIVAAGTAALFRGEDGAVLGRGTIAMVDPLGAAQVDQATDTEIEADPIVATNLSLDAEL